MEAFVHRNSFVYRDLVVACFHWLHLLTGDILHQLILSTAGVSVYKSPTQNRTNETVPIPIGTGSWISGYLTIPRKGNILPNFRAWFSPRHIRPPYIRSSFSKPLYHIFDYVSKWDPPQNPIRSHVLLICPQGPNRVLKGPNRVLKGPNRVLKGPIRIL